MENSVTVDRAIEFLNSILETDPVAIEAMFEHRVRCNHALADHPSVQVGTLRDDEFDLGLIGLLNGMFGTDEESWGYLCAVYDSESGRLLRFERTPDRTPKA